MSTTATLSTAVAGGDVSWQPPIQGAFASSFRLGEWITGPVTPLFEDWALTHLEAGMHAELRRWTGQPAPLPHHVVINGWYFYSLAWLPITPRALLRWAPTLISKLLTQPRRVAPVIPRTAHLGVPLYEREWRQELRPSYLTTAAEAEARVETLEPQELPTFIDDLLEHAGTYFAWIMGLAGAAYKAEMQLGRFYHKHLRPTIGGSHLSLVVGLAPPVATAPHAVESLDWAYPTFGERQDTTARSTVPVNDELRQRREADEADARSALAGSARRLRRFESLLEQAQRLGPVREQMSADFTLPWPAIRRALSRLGATITESGAIGDAEDVYFLHRQELEAALDGAAMGTLAGTIADRREAQRRAAELLPPAFVGDLPRFFERINRGVLGQLGADLETTGLAGVPVSPGTATGLVRVVHNADGFEAFQPGEILVAPTTAPAWNTLFAHAAAVVTDGGSLFAHASIASREYGIPAVVGCVDATRQLKDGQRVTVDGTRGTVMLVH